MFGSSLPTKEWIDFVNNRCHFTPDVAQLERSELQLLFCPGEMKRNFEDYQHIEDSSAYLCVAFTQKPFNFYQHILDQGRTTIPIEVEVPSTFIPNVKIKGELHAISTDTLIKLDKFKLNGVEFNRKRTKLVVPYRYIANENKDAEGKILPLALRGKKGILSPERVHLVDAWMYVGAPEHWNDLLDGGYLFQPVKTFTSSKERKWLRNYYELTNVQQQQDS